MSIPTPTAAQPPATGSLLDALSPDERRQVMAQAIKRTHARGTTILRRGDPGTGMIVVTSGRVRVGVTSEDGREITLGILGPGDVLGDMALLDGEARSADAVALEDCAVLVLERSRFLRLLHDTPELSLRLLAVVTQRLRRANLALEDIALLPLEQRLARLLIRLARDYGKAAQPGVRIELKLSQRDLSALVGASREKVNRQLRIWEEAGTIEKDQGYLLLRHPARLSSEAD
jgi:CRP/FNR family cyclic AMP-dependent transcriptional regulator